ncbi:hypothetical protein CAP39_00775 [Sphingomonas sp. IBVSS1]|nr:hypothetical protein CAP39_00775 [Sphingomonas sp. IBVSS1]
MRQQAERAETAKAIAEAKNEVISAGRDTLSIQISVFGILVTLIVAAGTYFSWRSAGTSAAEAAQAAISAARGQIDAELERAQTARESAEAARDKTQETARQAGDILATMSSDSQAQIAAVPTKDPPPLPAEDQTKLAEATAIIAKKAKAELSAQDFRILMLAAEQKGDWAEYLQLAEGMIFLHGGNPDDLDFALFGKAFALGQLARHSAAALAWEDYHQRCSHADLSRLSGAFNNWGNTLSDQAMGKTGPEADSLFAEAGAKYAEAVRIKPDDHEVWYNWGIALSDQARGTTGPEAGALLAEASAKYAEAVRIKPDYHEAWNNWGNALSEQVGGKTGSEADALFAEAGAKYAEAVRIKPDYQEAWYNWGTALSEQAGGKTGSDADALFAEAGAKYAEATRIKPDHHEAWYNWGNALSYQARDKTGPDADALFAEAGAKYAEAVRIKPDDHEAFNNWGNALLYQARGKTGPDADALFAEADAKFALAEAVRPGSAAYDRACVAALRGDARGAADMLRAAHKSDPTFPDCEHIACDVDFDAVRNSPEFQAALADIGCGADAP